MNFLLYVSIQKFHKNTKGLEFLKSQKSLKHFQMTGILKYCLRRKNKGICKCRGRDVTSREKGKRKPTSQIPLRNSSKKEGALNLGRDGNGLARSGQNVCSTSYYMLQDQAWLGCTDPSPFLVLRSKRIKAGDMALQLLSGQLLIY